MRLEISLETLTRMFARRVKTTKQAKNVDEVVIFLPEDFVLVLKNIDVENKMDAGNAIYNLGVELCNIANSLHEEVIKKG